MSIWKPAGILVVLACLVLPLPASALMLGLSTEKLTRSTALIVMGHVEDTASQWTADKKFITTTAVIRVQQFLKGTWAQKTVHVTYMGGQIGNTVMRQSDVAPLHRGDHVLLFLSPDEQVSGGAAWRIEGRAQGTYIIGQDHIARKRGFSVQSFDEHMDCTIALEALMEKIKSYVDEE